MKNNTKAILILFIYYCILILMIQINYSQKRKVLENKINELQFEIEYNKFIEEENKKEVLFYDNN